MATPNLDTIILSFRRLSGDNYVKDSETEITTADQNGQEFSCVEATDLAKWAINEVLQTALGAAGIKSVKNLFSEFLGNSEVTLTVSGNVGTGDLPADFAKETGAYLKRNSGALIRATQADEDYFNAVATGSDPELEGEVVYRVSGTTIEVAYYDSSTALSSSDKLELQFFKYQGSVTQGGATDVLIRPLWFGKVAQIMHAKAREFLTS